PLRPMLETELRKLIRSEQCGRPEGAAIAGRDDRFSGSALLLLQRPKHVRSNGWLIAEHDDHASERSFIDHLHTNGDGTAHAFLPLRIFRDRHWKAEQYLPALHVRGPEHDDDGAERRSQCSFGCMLENGA